ncbi:hypothetical protein SLS64_003394 [Diaporthe eres]|uniref:Uncharacterized protein n=1 Tax=Diaporthe eres TaxID=83184 RepID=A0ABR1PI37_DIAER
MARPSRRGPEALEGPYDPLTGEKKSQRPFEFPSPPALRLCQPQELARLKVPNDVPVQVLERMRHRRGHKRYVDYPSRLFHLRPQSDLRMTDDLDWEKAFLWQKVSRQHCEASWIQEFPCPALDLPLEDFPGEILRWGLSMRARKKTSRELLDSAAAVLNAAGRDPWEPTPVSEEPWRNVKVMALNIIRRLERQNNREAAVMAARVREHQKARDDYQSFFRFRDSDRKPFGMGFRGSRDVLLLDDEYLTDFLNRAGQRGTLGQRKRSDAKLVSFLNSIDAGKVTTVAVSARTFRDRKTRTYLCYAIVRTFPNLQRLLLTSIGTADLERELITYQFAQFGHIRDLADREVRENGGSSFIARPDEDPAALFDVGNMSPELLKATGAYADGSGRALDGDPARTPLVAYGVAAGLLHDPAAQARDDDPVDPPLVNDVQFFLSAAFQVFMRRREAASQATRADTLSKLNGQPTRLPRPVRGLPGSAQPVARLYRRTEVIPEGFVEWAWEHLAKLRRRAVWDEDASETDPESEASLPAAEVGPVDREYARAEPFLLVYNRDSFDRNVQSGWAGFSPGVDVSHLGNLGHSDRIR